MQSGESNDLEDSKTLFMGTTPTAPYVYVSELDYSSADLTKRVEIDEYLYMVNQSAVDLSTIMTVLKPHGLNFILVPIHQDQEAAGSYVGGWFDGIWFAHE